MRDRTREELALRPIGLALAAVVSGLAAPIAAAALEVCAATRAHAPDGEEARDEGDPELLLGPSEAVEPFAEAPPEPEPDLFEL